MEKEEAIQIDRSCRALSARIKEFGGKVFQTKGTADVNDLGQEHT